MKKMIAIVFCVLASQYTLYAQWLNGGNAFGANGVFGTTDNFDIDFITNNNAVGRWAATGNLLINTTTDNGNILQVNGNGWYSGTIFTTADISVGSHGVFGSHLNVGSHIDVGSHVNIGTDLTVNNNANINNDLNINNNLNVNNNSNFNGTSNFSGTVTVNDLFANNTMGVGVSSVTAGYVFEVAGSALASVAWNTSDARYKKSIKEISNVSDKLFSISSKSYEFRKDEFKEKRFDDKLHFGFIAQEIEKVYPNLVNKDNKGYYAVNYIEFIPLLLQALKEEDQKINLLQNELNELKSKLTVLEKTTGINNTTGKVQATLEQNVPNPFNGSTVIKFNIGKEYTNAFIGVYDMQGKQVKQLFIEKGMEQVTLEKGLLTAGMYMYSLVVDNNLIDTKRMIVAE